MHRAKQMIGLRSVWGQSYHKFEFFGCLLEAPEYRIHQGLLIHCINLSITP